VIDVAAGRACATTMMEYGFDAMVTASLVIAVAIAAMRTP
jgi:hypothetical protein